MKSTKTIALSAFCAALALSGAASAESVVHTGPGGAQTFHPTHGTSSMSAEQVRKELEEFRRNPVSADGQYRYVGGDQGWVPVSHEYAYRDGRWQHVDQLSHNTPAPSMEMTSEERKQYEAMYQGG